jgi:hypothetical protein
MRVSLCFSELCVLQTAEVAFSRLMKGYVTGSRHLGQGYRGVGQK